LYRFWWWLCWTRRATSTTGMDNRLDSEGS